MRRLIILFLSLRTLQGNVCVGYGMLYKHFIGLEQINNKGYLNTPVASTFGPVKVLEETVCRCGDRCLHNFNSFVGVNQGSSYCLHL